MDSVLQQNYEELEYIVIDGGSTDGSAELLQLKKEHFHFWISEKDGGIYNAMNKGIMKATGEFLLFLNSGDYLKDDEVIYRAAEHLTDQYDLYYGNLIVDMEPEQKLLEFPKNFELWLFLS